MYYIVYNVDMKRDTLKIATAFTIEIRQVEALDSLAVLLNKNRSEMVREAIDAYIEKISINPKPINT